jgi:hypothetical protein
MRASPQAVNGLASRPRSRRGRGYARRGAAGAAPTIVLGPSALGQWSFSPTFSGRCVSPPFHLTTSATRALSAVHLPTDPRCPLDTVIQSSGRANLPQHDPARHARPPSGRNGLRAAYVQRAVRRGPSPAGSRRPPTRPGGEPARPPTCRPRPARRPPGRGRVARSAPAPSAPPHRAPRAARAATLSGKAEKAQPAAPPPNRHEPPHGAVTTVPGQLRQKVARPRTSSSSSPRLTRTLRVVAHERLTRPHTTRRRTWSHRPPIVGHPVRE